MTQVGLFHLLLLLLLLLLPSPHGTLAFSPGRSILPTQGPVRKFQPSVLRRPARSSPRSKLDNDGRRLPSVRRAEESSSSSGEASASTAADDDDDVAPPPPDFGEIGKYVLATSVQFSLLAGLLKLIDWVSTSGAAALDDGGGGGGKLPLPAVGLLFCFLSLRSRVASVLDNSRPNVEATPSDVKRPSWTPPGIAFPFIWLTITVLRGVSSALVYRETGALFTPPLLAMILHLSVGDTWNTVTNVEKRLGASAAGCVVVWASVWNAIARYYRVLPLAGMVLSPSGVWISVATVLTMSIWRMNEPVQPLWPVEGDGRSAPFRWANLGQLQATSIGGSDP